MLPQSLNRVEFWRIRRLEQQDDVLWNLQILAGVEPSIIDLENIETIRELPSQASATLLLSLSHPPLLQFKLVSE